MEECSKFEQPIIFSTSASAQKEWRNAQDSGNSSFSPRRHKKNGGMLKIRATHHFLHVGTRRMEECSKFGQPIIFSTSAQKEWRNAQSSSNPSFSPRRHKKNGGMLKVRATHHFLHVGTKKNGGMLKIRATHHFLHVGTKKNGGMLHSSGNPSFSPRGHKKNGGMLKFGQPIIFSTSAQEEWRNAHNSGNPSFSPRRTKRMEECSKFGQPIIFSTWAQKEWRNAQNSGNPSFSPRRRRHKKNGGMLKIRATHHFLHVGTRRMEECSKFGQPIIFSMSAQEEWRNAQNSGNPSFSPCWHKKEWRNAQSSGNPSFSPRRRKNNGGMLKTRATHHFLHVGTKKNGGMLQIRTTHDFPHVGTQIMEECSKFGQPIIFCTSAQKEWRNAQSSGNPSFSPRRHKKNGGMLKVRATHHFLHVGTKRMEECSKFGQRIIFSTSAQQRMEECSKFGQPIIFSTSAQKRMEECSKFGQPIIFSTSVQRRMEECSKFRATHHFLHVSTSAQEEWRNAETRATHHFLHVGTRRMEECSKFGQPIIFSTSAQEEWRNAQNSGNPSFSPCWHKKEWRNAQSSGNPSFSPRRHKKEWRNAQNSGNPSFSPRRHKKNGGMLKIRATHHFLHVGTKRMEECSKFGQPIIFSASAQKEWRNAQPNSRRHKKNGGMLTIRATHHFLHVGVRTKRMEECSKFGQPIIFSTSAQKEWRNAEIRATHHFLHVGTRRMEECSKFGQPIIFSASAQKEWRNAQNSGNPSFSPRRRQHKKNGGMLKVRATHHFLPSAQT